jgi:hypothetical protein
VLLFGRSTSRPMLDDVAQALQDSLNFRVQV